MSTLLKTVMYLILLCFSMSNYSFAQDTSILDSLDQLRWKNRIIIVKLKDNHAALSVEKFQQNQTEIDDRDIIWFVIESNEKTVTSNYQSQLSQQLKTQIDSLSNDTDRQVILIGKDTGIKSQSNRLNLQDLFDQIDSMPMRIMEMQGYK